MRTEQQRIESAGLQVVLVGMGTPGEGETFRRELSITYPLVSDPGKALYNAYGLKRAGIAQTASPKIFFKGMMAMLSGHSLGVPLHDPLQMGGLFIIGMSGTILWSYYAKDVSDFPSVDEILAAFERSRQP